jgi:hypothetical protein
MQFKLQTYNFYSINSDKDQIKALKQLGFKFRKNGTIDRKHTPIISIDTLEELVDFTKKHGSIIFNEHTIEIDNPLI